METPKNQQRAPRKHTPRLSERKKSLFAAKNDLVSNDDVMQGIEPLDDENQNSSKLRDKHDVRASTPRSGVLKKQDSSNRTPSACKRRSLRLSASRSPGRLETIDSISPVSVDKENTPIQVKNVQVSSADENLELLFSTSMRLNGQHTPKSSSSKVSQDKTIDTQEIQKRRHEATDVTKMSPKRKWAKVETPIEDMFIPTKSFYSAVNSVPHHNSHSKAVPVNSPSNSVQRLRGPNLKQNFNKGVKHKIRRRNRPLTSRYTMALDVDRIISNISNDKLRNMLTAKRQQKAQAEEVHKIFRQARNPIAMARPLTALSDDKETNNNNVDVDLSKSSNQSMEKDVDFSDLETDSEAESVEADKSNSFRGNQIEKEIPLITHQSPEQELRSPAKKRKFFKSGQTSNTIKEVRITDNIKASVSNGKLSIIPEKERKRKKIKIKSTFSDEQATVNAILKNLDDTTYGDIVNTTVESDRVAIAEGQNEQKSDESLDDALSNDFELVDNVEYLEFRNRLPFNTNDPEVIERQHLLLDFLISNDICNEHTFTVFIADPDNHKAEAARIVDQVIVVVNEYNEYRQRIPYNTQDPAVIAQQHDHLDLLIKHNLCNEENFDILIANYEQRRAEADAIMASLRKGNRMALNSTEEMEAEEITSVSNIVTKSSNEHDRSSCSEKIAESGLLTQPTVSAPTTCTLIPAAPGTIQQEDKLFPIFYKDHVQPLVQATTRRAPKLWTGGQGSNQYQIDAGQKNFGARQCRQCGLVYTMHEPEEERLHRDFHMSLHVLRFKGWIDEDIVAFFPEWGNDGRILRATETSPVKRRERLMDILKVVDKELGFSSYILPKTYVAYFAVRKNQIVGVCLVQPLEKANKYLCINGVDCCTQEVFEAKCGISRIWVSPLNRRMHIATKLMKAVQLNTILGEEIPINKIAFSAPTASGKVFAQKFTKTDNFLVYQ